MLWRKENELKPDDLSYEDKYKDVEGDILLNIKRQAYLDIDCEALQNCNFVQSGEEEDNVEFSMKNSDLADLHLEGIDSVTHLCVKNNWQPSTSKSTVLLNMPTVEWSQ